MTRLSPGQSARELRPFGLTALMIGGLRWTSRELRTKVSADLKSAACLYGAEWLLICECRAFILFSVRVQLNPYFR